MGTYWSGIKTLFSEIDYLKNRIKELDFDYIEVIEHPASQAIDFTIKTTQLIKYSTPIAYGIKHLSEKEKKFYGTFFFHMFWTTQDDEHESYINTKKYTSNTSNDDLGWLKLDPEAYWKAFNYKTLELIVSDYEKINFNVIKKMYKLERSESKKQFEGNPNFNSSEYQKETEETFKDFITLSKNIVEIYKNCITEKKDLIIEFI
ncbi:hypothetical protein [Tenacibaculum agarivorans]|uniref:hypothetical protein n=1 Tax=Tenacibaculum agarivorans TaxID=1908389 RepID=UPI00094B9E8E|nr:hypothetical protein [Tenacibaculum agarivorans]